MRAPEPPTPRNPGWADACLAMCLFAVDPCSTGGVVVRAHAGPVRDRLLALLRELLPADQVVRRVPIGIGNDRLLGGLDLTATLKRGAPVAAKGLLAEADGGVLELSMAERRRDATVAQICAVLDAGEVCTERDGFSLRSTSRLGVIALDEGIEPDEQVAHALSDRLAFRLALEGISLRDVESPPYSAADIVAARKRLVRVSVTEKQIRALCATAIVLGVGSGRAPLLAVRVARAAAALAERTSLTDDDVMLAARLVLAHRATRLPSEADEQEADPPSQDPDPESNQSDEPPEAKDAEDVGELVVKAAEAAIPADLLARLGDMAAVRSSSQHAGRSGDTRGSDRRGRPIGVRSGDPRSGARLSVIETLRAAAPWQTLRRRQRGSAATPRRVEVRRDDYRVVKHKEHSQATIIFAVDASGSAALHRLGEAKGAVELLLADCYIRRDQVALLAFRKQTSELLLPATRSLVRAKRCLAGLPGGGATPLAAGIESASLLALAERRKGNAPSLIVMTDGRANIARDGTADRGQATEDAICAARSVRGARIPSLVVDTSPRSDERARRLAGEMGATYLPLPHADAATLSTAIQTVRGTPA